MKIDFFKPVILSCILIIFLLLSNILTISNPNNFNSLLNKNEIIQIKGYLKSSPVKLSNKKYYSSQLKCISSQDKNGLKSECKGLLSVNIPSELIEAYYPGKLFSKSTNESNYLYEEGGFYSFKGKLKNDIFFVEKCEYCDWNGNTISKLYNIRANLRIYIKRLMYKWGDAGGLFMALITGSREYTNDETKNNFRSSGLSHILALSGMHLSLLSGLAAFIGNKTKRLRISYLIRITAILIFVFIAGFSPSLLRAFISFCLLLYYSLINNKKADMFFIVCLTFIIQINIDPVSVNNAGFILSYGALFGILLLNNFFEKYFTKFLPNKIASSISASASAQIFTSPFSLNYFGEIYPVGIIASVIVSPLVTIFIYSGLFLFFISLILPFFTEVSGIFMNLLYTVISFLVRNFSYFPKIKI